MYFGIEESFNVYLPSHLEIFEINDTRIRMGNPSDVIIEEKYIEDDYYKRQLKWNNINKLNWY